MAQESKIQMVYSPCGHQFNFTHRTGCQRTSPERNCRRSPSRTKSSPVTLLLCPQTRGEESSLNLQHEEAKLNDINSVVQDGSPIRSKSNNQEKCMGHNNRSRLGLLQHPDSSKDAKNFSVQSPRFWKSIQILRYAHGLFTSSTHLTNLLRVVQRSLRVQGIRVLIYLDDIIIHHPIKSKCRIHTLILRKTLQNLGFIINESSHQKSRLKSLRD